MATPDRLITQIKTKGTTTTTATSLNNMMNDEDDNWVKYIFVVGIAAAVLIICIVIAIVASRFKTLRKAKAQYRRAQIKTKKEIEEQKRASMSRALPTTANSNDPFFVHRPDTKINPLVVGIFEGAEAPAFGAAKRGSYVQAISSFLQAPHQPMAVNIQRDVTPPPKLSPLFQTSEERLQERQTSLRRNIVPSYAYQQSRESDSPLPLLPRERILPPRIPNRYSQNNNLHQSRKIPITRHRSRSLFELSPSLQASEERLNEDRMTQRSHRASSYPYQQPRKSYSLSSILPREPILPPRIPRRNSHNCSPHQRTKTPETKQPSQSVIELSTPFHTSRKRSQEARMTPGSHSDSSTPYQSVLLPEKPILPPRRTRQESNTTVYSRNEIKGQNQNFGPIDEETEPTSIMRQDVVLPEPDYD